MDNWKQFHKLTFVHDSSMMLSVVLGTALGDPYVPLADSFKLHSTSQITKTCLSFLLFDEKNAAVHFSKKEIAAIQPLVLLFGFIKCYLHETTSRGKN